MLTDRLFDFRQPQYFMSDQVGIQHGRAQPGKLLGYPALAAGDAADNANYMHDVERRPCGRASSYQGSQAAQFGPVFTSTFKGTVNCMTPDISSATIFAKWL